MKYWTVVYRRQGCPNGQHYYTTVKAMDRDMAETLAYMKVKENYTILAIMEDR